MPPDLPVRELLPQSPQVRLFSTQNCVRPEETPEYTKVSNALWTGINSVGPVGEMVAAEIARGAWPLHRRSRSPVAPAAYALGEGPTPTIRTQSVAPAVSAAGVGQSPPVCGFVPDFAWQPIPNRWSPIPGSPQRRLPMPFRPEIQALVWSGLPRLFLSRHNA